MKKSLGTLAAVAALSAAQQAHSVVVVSSISNLAVTDETELDIDGDGSVDFFINGEIGEFSNDGVIGNSFLDSSGDVTNLGFDIFVNSAGTFATSGSLDGFLNSGLGYAGVEFTRNSGTTSHFAWISFLSTDLSYENIVIQGAAWESNDDTGIFTGAVPEPSMFGLITAFGAVAVVSLRRRRRSSSN